MSRKKIIMYCSIIGVVFLLIILNFITVEIYSFRYGNPIKRVSVKNIVIRAEVVSSPEKLEQGLAGRKSLAANTGMLFLMPADKIQQFWMKGMQFPIDIIWIENGRAIGCEHNIDASNTNIFTSPGFSSMVLEVNKGFCDEHNISINDPVVVQ